MTTRTFLSIEQDALTRFQGDSSNMSNYPLLGQWVNDAYHYINAYAPWKWTEKTNSGLTLTSGTQNIATSTIDSQYRVIADLVNITANYAARLTKLNSAQELDRYKPIQNTTTEGPPIAYYIWNNNMYVFPVPDQTYTFECRYYATDADLVNNNDVPNLPVQAVELLVIHGYSQILQQNFMYDQAAYQDKLFQAKLDKLVETEIEDNLDDTLNVEIDEPSYDKSL